MANYPKLKTGAPAQYGSSKDVRYFSEVLRYLDGSEQRMMQRQAEISWHLRYEQLTEEEVRLLSDFFHDNHGQAGRFSFEDPWTGEVLESCHFDQSEIEFEWSLDGQASTSVVIRKEGPR